MKLSKPQQAMLSNMDAGGRCWCADRASTMQAQSAFWRTAESLERKGLLSRMRGSDRNGYVTPGFQLTLEGYEYLAQVAS